jgi:hypothetical protein
MGLLVVITILVVLVAAQVVRSIMNPVVTVVDDRRSARPYAELDADVARLLGGTRGYDLRMVLPGTYTLSYRRTPGWALLLGLVTFPIGILIILLSRETFVLTFAVTATEAGSRVTVVGRAHEKVALAVGAAIERRLAEPMTATGPRPGNTSG